MFAECELWSNDINKWRQVKIWIMIMIEQGYIVIWHYLLTRQIIEVNLIITYVLK